MEQPGRVVVIGAGLGGLRTVESLRRRGYSGRIALLGAERHLPYDRPPLSKHVLRGERDVSWLRSADDVTALDVSLHLDTPATGLSVDRRTVNTASGSHAFDVAVIATGALPRRLVGMDAQVLRTLDDAYALRAALHAGSRLAVVGAGLIGCEVAASARAMGVEVTLLDVLPAPATRVLGSRVGRILGALHARHGVQLRLGVGLAGSEPGRVLLDDGSIVEADAVLQSIGVTPDIAWLRGSELNLNDGVMCDAGGRAAPGVFAVGDVANWAGHRHEHWTSVGTQADHVAAQILGQDSAATDVAYWWSDQYDLKLQGLGRPAPDDDVEVRAWGPRARTVAVYSRNGRLTGLVGFSASSAIMRLRSDVAAGTDVQKILERFTEPMPHDSSAPSADTPDLIATPVATQSRPFNSRNRATPDFRAKSS
ncbi:NAD(P)/FAD-dependent oxidoreductase [uncultured Jatrophihabitans sp.]|uniref:NAD(P)/FAD-dependent oxidoreductase n=1 Tax=uncultured Jatrophihabitans sp. TaxID=1610747 RepID=UPI0035CC09DD